MKDTSVYVCVLIKTNQQACESVLSFPKRGITLGPKGPTLCNVGQHSPHFYTAAPLEALCGFAVMTYEYDYSQVLDREAQMDNPCGWLEDVYWDNITELDK